ncbi:MAG: CheR family methyltransferase [Acidobacteriota bacterium]
MGETAGFLEILPENYRLLQQSVYANVGIVVQDDKEYLFKGRLAPVVKQLGLNSINELCSVLQKPGQSDVAQMVGEAMTTNETYFFREPLHYEAIKKHLLPRLIAERPVHRRMSFWSAASSTGQEAYSLAMLLLEQELQDWTVHILGTDISNKVIERARKGLYQQIEVNRGLPAPMLVRHFHRTGMDWQLSEAVRRMVHFRNLDLRQEMRTIGPFDLVFCRNVMIYFDAETKRKMLQDLHSTLFRGGWLLLGGAETPVEYDPWFERCSIGGATVYVAR